MAGTIDMTRRGVLGGTAGLAAGVGLGLPADLVLAQSAGGSTGAAVS